MPYLELVNLHRGFGAVKALDGIELKLDEGEFVSLLGPSGCGKTTLLRMIAGFDLPDAGRIVLAGEDLAGRPPELRPVRTVFQSYALFPHMTVEGNVAFPLQMARVPARSVPSSRMWPSVGSSKPPISRSVVVLPQPDGPSSEKNSPASIRRSIRSTATASP